jgi:hypothetical protein
MSFILIGGALFELSNSQDSIDNQPLFWPLAVGFSSAGGAIIIGLFLKHLLPDAIMNEMINIKKYKI